MYVYKAKIQSDGSLDKLNFIIVVGGYLQNEGMIGYTWYLTASISTLKYFLEDDSNHKARVHQLGFIGSFLQANVRYIFLWICIADIETTSHNIGTILEDH